MPDQLISTIFTVFVRPISTVLLAPTRGRCGPKNSIQKYGNNNAPVNQTHLIGYHTSRDPHLYLSESTKTST